MARSCALLQVYLAILFAHIALFPTFCSAVPEAGAPGPAVVLWFASSEFPLSDAYSALAEAFVGAAGKPSRLMPQPPLEVGTTLDQLSSIVSNVLTGDDLVKGPGRVFLAAHGTSCAALLAPVSTAVEQAAASAQAPAKPGSLEVTIGGIKIHGTVLAGCTVPPSFVGLAAQLPALALLGELDGVYSLDSNLPLYQAYRAADAAALITAVLTGITNAQFATGERVNVRDVLPQYAIEQAKATEAIARVLAAFSASPLGFNGGSAGSGGMAWGEGLANGPNRRLRGAMSGAVPQAMAVCELQNALNTYAPHTAALFDAIVAADAADATSTCKNLMAAYLQTLPGAVAEASLINIAVNHMGTNVTKFVTSSPALAAGTLTLTSVHQPTLGSVVDIQLACKGRRRDFVSQLAYGLSAPNLDSVYPAHPTEAAVSTAAAAAAYQAATALLLPHQSPRLAATSRGPALEPTYLTQLLPTGTLWVNSLVTAAYTGAAPATPLPHTSPYLLSSWPPSAPELAVIQAIQGGVPCSSLACQQRYFGAFYTKTLGVRGMLQLLSVAALRY